MGDEDFLKEHNPMDDSLSPEQQAELEEELLKFDRQWTPALLSDVINQMAERDFPYQKTALRELVKIDLERRWRIGQRPTLESYLEQFEELGTAETVSVELIFTEYEIRRQFHKPAMFSEFAQRFPWQALDLKQLIEQEQVSEDFSILQSTETLGPGDTNSAQANSARRSKWAMPQHMGDRYEIQRTLGEGAMGCVYLATDKELARQVALKTPHFQGKQSHELIARFELEAQSAARLIHPFICKVFDYGHVDEFAFITMEYVKGQSLDRVIGKSPLPERHAARLAQKIAQALQHAHENGVAHRDIKPGNIMVDRHSNPKITDFGLARQIDQDPSARKTQDGMILGTPAYMAPEQVQAVAEQTGPLVDIYALGVVLYEMLTGQLPFQGSVTAVLAQISTVPPPNLLTLCPDLDPPLAALCLRMMAKDPEARPQSMKDVTSLLGEILKENPGEHVQPAHTALEKRTWNGRNETRTCVRNEIPCYRDPMKIAIWTGVPILVLLGIFLFMGEKGDRKIRIRTNGPRPAKIDTENMLNPYGFSHREHGPVADEAPLTPEIATSDFSVEGSSAKNANLFATSDSPEPDQDGWMHLFNGKDLTGWTGDTARWQVKNGELICNHFGGHAYLFHPGNYSDFELHLTYKMKDKANSGLIFRCEQIAPDRLKGIESDLRFENAKRFYGSFVICRAKGKFFSEVVSVDPAQCHYAETLSPDGWNRIVIRAVGHRIAAELNGVRLASFTDDTLSTSGGIALQRFVGNSNGQIRILELRLRNLLPDAEIKNDPDEPPIESRRPEEKRRR